MSADGDRVQPDELDAFLIEHDVDSRAVMSQTRTMANGDVIMEVLTEDGARHFFRYRSSVAAWRHLTRVTNSGGRSGKRGRRTLQSYRDRPPST